MTFFRLTKIATQLVYPLSLAIALVIAAYVLLRRRRERAARRVLVAAIVLLWIPSMPVVSFHLRNALEMRFPPVQPADAPTAGAIVLLGGALSVPHPPLFWMDLNQSADRILHAARLWRAGKAPLVISSGGGGSYTGGPQTPADAMADLLVEWGVPRDAILLERRSRDTWENALFSKELLDERGIRDVLVVTSAAHMPRSLAVFRSLGLNALPAATDYAGGASIDHSNPTVWLPDAGALWATAAGVKEYLGIAVYWMRGWIRDPRLGWSPDPPR